ncbi:MAG: SH3 domain-containing protein [Anaerolineales bacterium]|nr:SH3 domain-containing protein [Anaerolineales bacterium]
MARRSGLALAMVCCLGLLWSGLGGPPHASAAAAVQVETNTPPPWWVEIFEDVNVRAGPGTDYDWIGTLIPGQTSEVLGRSPTGAWLKIRYIGGPDNTGWVLRDFVRVMGDAPNLPTIVPPPTPTLPPTTLPGLSDPGAAGVTVTPDPNANRLPTFTPPALEIRPTLLPAQGQRVTSGFPPAVLIIVLFVLGTFGGMVSLLRRR